ncbi:MAG: hypothetical protein NVSMB25_04550 [Thermoleophilaceae bacterium]
MDQSTRSPLRLAAPAALAIFAIATLMIVATSSGGSSETSNTKASLEKQRDLGTGTLSTPQAEPRPKRLAGSIYIVKDGDTLGSISVKKGLSVQALQRLNPRVDPQTLTSGQKLKLR